MAEREHFTNGRCLTFGTGSALTATAFGAQVSGWTHWVTEGIGYGIGIVMMLIATVLIAKSYFSGQSEQTAISSPQPSGTIPGIPTLSALLGQNPSVEFDAKQFFALAHYSPITAEIEKNIKIIAQQNSPNDKEAFYARFIGVGVVAYQHDVSWFTIFGSQLRAMEEMNSRGILPITDIKKHYDKAASDFPKTYENYSFDQWLAFMISRMLIAVYPSQMVELSWNGKDFLKYLSHVGRNTNGKAN
jgi:hypothetical protein